MPGAWASAVRVTRPITAFASSSSSTMKMTLPEARDTHWVLNLQHGSPAAGPGPPRGCGWFPSHLFAAPVARRASSVHSLRRTSWAEAPMLSRRRGAAKM